ncbi:PTS sugar transporter subunit IIA [uncultured Thomasclavelia sp.]|uniref:PTS sugar transporter subunit IIA n=1 Tax=uncultured Thomasclavelia sp. TaxID=3025759 RepID=UPI0025D508C2|nr:PTS fructose transporter subunit IIA [uncultured Thomasclavelia sp.]
MKYLVLVSHGEFASGLENALSMLAGKRDDVIAVGLKDGKSADDFAVTFENAIAKITSDDEIVLLADLIGGSPLTTALSVIAKKEMTDKCLVIGGMNLPLALTTVLMKDTFDNQSLASQVLSEAKDALKEFKLDNDEEDDI